MVSTAMLCDCSPVLGRAVPMQNTRVRGPRGLESGLEEEDLLAVNLPDGPGEIVFSLLLRPEA